MLTECTHMYNGSPVKISTRYNYGLDPSTLEVYDPKLGQYMIAPVKDLKALGKITVIVSDDGVIKQSDLKKSAKKEEKPKSVKKVEKKENKKDEKKSDKKEKKSEKKEKKSLKKEDITERIDNLLDEGWFNDKKDELKLTLKDAYVGAIKFVKDMKTMAGDTFTNGKRLFAKKEANQKGVRLYRDAGDIAHVNPPIKVVPFDMLNSYVQYLAGKPAYESVLEDKIDNFLNENK